MIVCVRIIGKVVHMTIKLLFPSVIFKQKMGWGTIGNILQPNKSQHGQSPGTFRPLLDIQISYLTNFGSNFDKF